MCYKVMKCNACVMWKCIYLCSQMRNNWGSRDLRRPFKNPMTAVCLLVFPSHHPSFHLVQPTSPERAAFTIFITWWGFNKRAGCAFFYSAVHIRSDITFSITVLSMTNFVRKLCAKFMVPSVLQNHQDLRNIAFKEEARHLPSRCSIIYLVDDGCNELKPHH